MLHRPLQIREVGPLGLFRHLIGGRRSRSRRTPVIGGGERLLGRREAGAARGPARAPRVVGRGRGGKMAGAGGRPAGVCWPWSGTSAGRGRLCLPACAAPLRGCQRRVLLVGAATCPARWRRAGPSLGNGLSEGLWRAGRALARGRTGGR